jgi:hypothetical protein
MYPGRQAAALLCAIALSSCGAQKILVEDTRSFVAAGREASASATQFFAEARSRQIQANILLIAAEPSCEWGTNIRLRKNFVTGREGLCLKSGSTEANNGTYSLEPIPLEAIKPSLDLIAALSAYLGALSRVSNPYEPQIGPAIDNVVEKLSLFNKAEAFFTRTEPQRVAIVDLLEYFNELRAYNGQAKQIRDYVNKNGDRFEAGRAALAEILQNWNVGIVEGSAQLARDSLIQGINRSLRKTSDFNRRRKLLAPITEIIGEQQSAKEGFSNAVALINELQTVHNQLRDFANKKYSVEDKIRIERENSAQIWGIISRLGAVASVF